MADFEFLSSETYTPLTGSASFTFITPIVTATLSTDKVVGDGVVTLTGSSNVDIETWSWSVESGVGVILEPTQQNTTLVLSKDNAPQTINVQLEGTYNSFPYTDTKTITHNLEPVLDITATPAYMEGTGTIVLSATSNVSVSAWQWEIVSGLGVFDTPTQQTTNLNLVEDNAPQILNIRLSATIDSVVYTQNININHATIRPIITAPTQFVRGTEPLKLTAEVEYPADSYRWVVKSGVVSVNSLERKNMDVLFKEQNAFQEVVFSVFAIINGVEYESDDFTVTHNTLWGSSGNEHNGLVRVDITGDF